MNYFIPELLILLVLVIHLSKEVSIGLLTKDENKHENIHQAAVRLFEVKKSNKELFKSNLFEGEIASSPLRKRSNSINILYEDEDMLQYEIQEAVLANANKLEALSMPEQGMLPEYQRVFERQLIKQGKAKKKD
jgi:hypothetical protein